MKKFILLFVTMAIVSACTNKSPKPEEQVPQDSWHESSRDSLDYWGTYSAVEPSSGKNISKLELLQDSKYRIKRADGAVLTGLYEWDVTGSVIYMKNRGKGDSRLFVGEDYVKFVSRGPDKGRIFRKE